MNDKNYYQALLAFGNYHTDLSIDKQKIENFTVTALSGGLINQTFKVEAPLTAPFVLQQINQHVFTNPENVQANYLLLSQYNELALAAFKLPKALPYQLNNTLFKDEYGNYWRAFEYIENSSSFSIAQTPEQSKNTANTFANFTNNYTGLQADLLYETIPGFHNLSLRYRQFLDSLHSKLPLRLQKAQLVIDELKKREHLKLFYETITTSSAYQKRVMHHDAKIANILFNATTGNVICPVDLDTAMPGYFFSDLGDMIRSMAASTDENDIEFEKIEIRKDFYEAILSGYLEEMDKTLTTTEKKHIHYSGLVIIYMQALRFITDFLNGDVYYKVEYAEQNLIRAKNQLTLLQKLEELLKTDYALSSF